MTDTISQLLKPETFPDGQGPLDATKTIMDMVSLGSEPETEEEPEFVVTKRDEPEEEDDVRKDIPEEDKRDDGAEEPSEAATDEEDDSDPYHWPDEIPKLKAKRGELEFEIPEDAIVGVKVNGKVVDVPVSELRLNYQGKIPWNQKYGELNRKEKDLEHREIRATQEVTKVKGRLRELVQHAKKDPFGASIELFLESGASPDEAVEFVKAHFAQIKVTGATMGQLSDPELEARVLHRALEVKEKALRKIQDVHETNEKSVQEHQQIARYLETRQKELGISESEMDEAIEIAKGSDAKEFWEMPMQKRADTLMNYVTSYLKPRAMVGRAITKVAPQLSDNEKFHGALLDIVRKENLTPEQVENTVLSFLRGMAKSSNGHSSNGATTKRETPLASSNEPQARTKKAAKKAEPNAENTLDPVSMDEILERYKVR